MIKISEFKNHFLGYAVFGIIPVLLVEDITTKAILVMVQVSCLCIALFLYYRK